MKKLLPIVLLLSSLIVGCGGDSAQTSSNSMTNLDTTTPDSSNISNLPPSASFVTSGNAYNFTLDQEFDIEVLAEDTDGSIVAVDLMLNGEVLRTENYFPFEWHSKSDAKLVAMGPGVHTLTAQITDNTGAITTTTIPLVLNHPNCII